MKKLIQNIFGLRKDVGLNFYLADFFFRKILRQNADTTWAIHHSSTVLVPGNIKRGKDVYPGDSPGNYIEALNGIEIGDFTNIGPHVGILSTNHDMVDNSKFTTETPVKIGSFCWIGIHAVILPGVELGDFTIVGAGAIVTKSFPKGYCVLGGNPATIIKQLDIDACKQFRDSKYSS